MIAAISVSRFVWTPFAWMFVVIVSLFIVAIVCNIFNNSADNEIDIRERSRADENEMVKDETAVFARKYLKIWMGNHYKYVLLPLLLVLACLAILLTE